MTTDLIAESAETCLEKAVKLAGDLKRLQNLRTNLRDMMSHSVLTDGHRFTRALEDAFRKMWRDWREIMEKEMVEQKQKRNKKSTQGVDTTSPRISLCMIVKDEEKCLPGCLDSVKDHVDEMIVVDTGSTDRTVEIARSYGARVYHHPWEKNFSKHRNQSISYATGDWILIMDADEELDAKTARLLRKVVDEAAAPVVLFNVRSYLSEGSYYTEGTSGRLFRNGLGIHYRGCVHNQLIYKDKRSTYYPIVIWHYGYDLSSEQIRAKRERSLALLKKQAKDFPDDISTRYHLAMTWLVGKEYDRAHKDAILALDMMKAQGKTDTIFSCTYFVAVMALINLERIDDAEALAREALRFFDKSIDIHHCLAQIGFAKKEYSKVVEHGREFFRLREDLQKNFSQFKSFQFETVQQEWVIYRAMGYANIYLGHHSEGVDLLVKAVKTAPACGNNALREEIGLNLARLKEKAWERAVWFLDKLPRGEREFEKGLMELGANYERLDRLEEAVTLYDQIETTFEENAEIPFKRGLLLIKLNRYAEAAQAFEKAVQKNPDYVEALVNWGLAMEGMGAKDAAEEKYRVALAINPDSPKGNLNLGLFYFKQSDYARAREYLQKSAADFSENVYICLALSRAYLATGEIEAMVGTCEKALCSLDLPSDFVLESMAQLADLYIGIAEKLHSQRRIVPFKLALEIALISGSDRVDRLRELALWALDLGEHERGVKVLEAALAIDPKDPQTMSLMQSMLERYERIG
ncbi:MAG: tetratricopeptide repeat protein [Deltaproteobacteria bacterium]|nr:tetratricopeptide repeat protein [Deltaproteobacteria bacterium]MBW2646415.1 tetratricopeptide repeat protein [Deltaproteobacteria bacterium]